MNHNCTLKKNQFLETAKSLSVLLHVHVAPLKGLTVHHNITLPGSDIEYPSIDQYEYGLLA